MRKVISLAVLSLVFVSAPAMAGVVSVANGQLTWEPTQCTAPQAPASILNADRASGAEDMNTRVTQYNAYSQQMQTYMECLSHEAETDANNAQQAIIKAASTAIGEAQANLDKLGAPLRAKQ